MRRSESIESKVNLELINMSEVEVEEVEWLWFPYIPLGKITIMQGDPGGGKTTLALQLCSIVTNGIPLPFDGRPYESMNVIYQTAEDGIADTIKPRLLNAGADCSKISIIDETKKSLDLLDERLKYAIEKTKAKLLILDPIQAYIGSKVNLNSANEVRAVMNKIGNLANQYKVAVIFIGHMNKGGGPKSTYRGLGSIDIQAVARSVLIIGKDDTQENRRVMAVSKASLAKEGKSVIFEITEQRGIEFISQSNISADELLGGMPSPLKSNEAEKIILEMLAEGEVLSEEVMEKCALYNISKRTVNEVKKSLGVKSKRIGNQWYFYLPEMLD